MNIHQPLIHLVVLDKQDSGSVRGIFAQPEYKAIQTLRENRTDLHADVYIITLVEALSEPKRYLRSINAFIHDLMSNPDFYDARERLSQEFWTIWFAANEINFTN